jgi:hypothetical protein
VVAGDDEMEVSYCFDREKKRPIKYVDAGLVGIFFCYKGGDWDLYQPTGFSFSPVAGCVPLVSQEDPTLSWASYIHFGGEGRVEYKGLVLGNYILFMRADEFCFYYLRDDIEKDSAWFRVDPDLVGW